MEKLKIMCVFFLVGCMIKQLQGQCTTPSGAQGQCKSINTCEPLFPIVNKPHRTPQDIDFLRRSHCGFVGNSPAVCCPEDRPTASAPRTPSVNRCTTPDRHQGQCIDAYSCAHILQMLLAKPISEKTVQFVQNSRCNGPEPHSVCCGPAPVIAPERKPVQVTTPVPGSQKFCAQTASALPPDPSSGCCGLDVSSENKITGGTAAELDQFPWMALIEYVKRDGQIGLWCGGGLISARYVLTAAHCVVGMVPEKAPPKSVRLGEHNTTNTGPDCILEDCNEGALSIPIETITPHAYYTTNAKWNDIALIRIVDPAPFNDFIRPICLPTGDITLTHSFYNLTVAGWGTVSEKVRHSDVMMYVDLPYVERDRCQQLQQAHGPTPTIRTTQLCAGGVQGKDSCKGDSGGPLMLEAEGRNSVIGLVSYGHKMCGMQNYPGVYTNVFQYLDWIRSNIRQ